MAEVARARSSGRVASTAIEPLPVSLPLHTTSPWLIVSSPIPLIAPVSLPLASRPRVSERHVSVTIPLPPPSPRTVAVPVRVTAVADTATASELDVPQRDVNTAS